MKKQSLFFTLFLCLALVFAFASAEEAYTPKARTNELIDAALNAGQVVGGEMHLSLALDDGILSAMDDDAKAQFEALTQTLEGVSLAGGLGKLDNGFRLELGGAYTAPSQENVFVTAAANLTADGISVESNLIEGERVSIKWETILALLGLSDEEASQLLALRDMDWDSAMDEFSAAVAQTAQEMGRLAEPYLNTLADFAATLDIEERSNVAAEDGYPAVDHEITINCTAEDLGRLLNTLADQMEKDEALLPYIEQFVTAADFTVTDGDGEETLVTTTEQFFVEMRKFADALAEENTSIGFLMGYTDDGQTLYLTLALSQDENTAALLFQMNPGETENTMTYALTALSADEDGELDSRSDFALTLTRDPADANAYDAAFTVQTDGFNMDMSMAQQSIVTEDGLPGYETPFTFNITLTPDSYGPVRYIYTGSSQGSLTASGGEQSITNLSADAYLGNQQNTVQAESGMILEPKDGYLSGRLYVNETVTGSAFANETVTNDMPVSFGADIAVSSWDYDAEETAALQETAFETATGEELTALQNRFAQSFQQKLTELLALLPSEVLAMLSE